MTLQVRNGPRHPYPAGCRRRGEHWRLHRSHRSGCDDSHRTLIGVLRKCDNAELVLRPVSESADIREGVRDLSCRQPVGISDLAVEDGVRRDDAATTVRLNPTEPYRGVAWNCRRRWRKERAEGSPHDLVAVNGEVAGRAQGVGTNHGESGPHISRARDPVLDDITGCCTTGWVVKRLRPCQINGLVAYGYERQIRCVAELDRTNVGCTVGIPALIPQDVV